MATPLVSAVVLIGEINDKTTFEKCLKSLSWCEEIIKIDTRKISGSFADWRNEGLKRAKGEWVFYIDTDEVINEGLKKELLFTVHSSQFTAFAIPRRNFIFGKEFRHGGQYPDYQIRLFRKSYLIKWQGNLHETPVYNGELEYLKNPILHYKNISISQMLEKTNKWSEIEADLLFKSKHPKMNFIRFLSVAFREFWLRFVKQLSFLDGVEGVIYGVYQIYSRLISYSKLWEKQL